MQISACLQIQLELLKLAVKHTGSCYWPRGRIPTVALQLLKSLWQEDGTRCAGADGRVHLKCSSWHRCAMLQGETWLYEC